MTHFHLWTRGPRGRTKIEWKGRRGYRKGGRGRGDKGREGIENGNGRGRERNNALIVLTVWE